MSLYTERHGMRMPVEKTSTIAIEIYSVLLDCCEKYYKYLTYIFPLKSHCDFVDEDYIEFHTSQFENRMKIRIPNLFRDEYDRISVPRDFDRYDQYALIDLIEYIGGNVKDISEGWNNERYRNYWYIECLKTSKIFKDFQNQINEIFDEAGLLFTLTEEKIVERVVENSVLSAVTGNIALNAVDKGTRELLEEAITLFRKPHPQEQKKAVEKIWDALESLKTHFPGIENNRFDDKLAKALANGQNNIESILKKELSELGNIGNNYSIRHFNDTQVAITDGRHYDYFFNRCLALITLAIQYLKPDVNVLKDGKEDFTF